MLFCLTLWQFSLLFISLLKFHFMLFFVFFFWLLCFCFLFLSRGGASVNCGSSEKKFNSGLTDPQKIIKIYRSLENSSWIVCRYVMHRNERVCKLLRVCMAQLRAAGSRQRLVWSKGVTAQCAMDCAVLLDRANGFKFSL